VLEDLTGVSDVVNKLEQRAEAELLTPAAVRADARREMREATVRSSGPVDDDRASALLGVWGDPSTDGGEAGRFG
jgi:hypothetical protein